nr:putative inactive receptor kinase [Quercus suber]
MGHHCFYIYYNGEQYFHEFHGLSYRGESVKQMFIELKCGTHLRKMHRKIMEALGLDNTEVLGTTHTHDMGEFIDTDGLVDDAEVLDGPQIENNEEDCPTIVPIPEWFTSNTWDNINDPSPALGTGHLTSWHIGDQLMKGMLFKNKASVQYVLTLFSMEHNKQYKVIKFDTNRLVVWCIHEACLWSIRASRSKKHGMWQISKFYTKHNHDATKSMDRFYRVEEWYHNYEPIFQPLKDRKEAALQQREVCSSNTVAMSCVAKVPDLRRTMDEVVRMIEKIKQSYSEKQPSSEENNSKDTHNWTP